MTKKLPLFAASSFAGLAILLTSLSAADAPAAASASAKASASGSASAKPAAASASASASASGSAARPANTGTAAKPDLSKLPKASDKKDLTFVKDIEPMLKASCSGCHIAATKFSGGLDLSTLASALKGGSKMKDKDIVPGHGDQSFVLLYAADTIGRSEMPPLNRRTGATGHPPLTKDQLADLRAWIDQGAK